MATATRKRTPAAAKAAGPKETQTREQRESAAGRKPGESPAATPNAVVVKDGGAPVDETTEAPTEPTPASEGEGEQEAKAPAAGRSRAPKAAREGLTARQAIDKVLGEATEPLKTSAIVELVLPLVPGLKGKTPGASIAAVLVVGVKKGTYERTAPGTYQLKPAAE